MADEDLLTASENPFNLTPFLEPVVSFETAPILFRSFLSHAARDLPLDGLDCGLGHERWKGRQDPSISFGALVRSLLRRRFPIRNLLRVKVRVAFRPNHIVICSAHVRSARYPLFFTGRNSMPAGIACQARRRSSSGVA